MSHGGEVLAEWWKEIVGGTVAALFALLRWIGGRFFQEIHDLREEQLKMQASLKSHIHEVERKADGKPGYQDLHDCHEQVRAELHTSHNYLKEELRYIRRRLDELVDKKI